MNKLILFTFLLISTSICYGQNRLAPDNTAFNLDTCQVYQAVLGDEKPLVIGDFYRSEEYGRFYTFSKRNPKFAVIQLETLKSLKKDGYLCEIKRFVNLEPKKTMIRQNEVDSYFKKLQTNREPDLLFIEKYKTNHYYKFSNVGFNKNKDQALLTYYRQNISFFGTEVYYVILSKLNGEWKVIEKEVILSS